ncbi:uncharacterized protein FMAN_07331 [Fusarium mangiferae]|uniref:Uncharacterized protein n=1 Tax=Fusarium mangiferae TaxID=192010 RepID=A0A1L7TA34_FUSMA|nr:uncharacterized protein FMAN_07331 [Fusarium mangiferae]CVK92435.1 uncharacterized protein FMAN_07331 [Fusarium mangiferae]
MDIRNKTLPPTPREHPHSMACGHRNARPCLSMLLEEPCTTPEDGFRKENEDLKKANEVLQRQVQQLALENNVLQDRQTKSQHELKHYLEIIEIQKTSLKEIMQYILISTSDCRATVQKKRTEWETREAEDAFSSMDMDMF